MERGIITLGEFTVTYAKGYTRGEVSKITKQLYDVASAGKDDKDKMDLQKAMAITEESLTILIKEVTKDGTKVEIATFLEEVGNIEYQTLQKELQKVYSEDPTFKELEEAGKKAMEIKKNEEALKKGATPDPKADAVPVKA